MTNKKITVSGRIKAKQGMEEQLKQSLLSVLEPTRAEPGCINFYLHQGLDDKSAFMAYQNWFSKEAEDEHYKQPYMQAYMSEAPGMLAGAPDITVWKLIEPKTTQDPGKEEGKMEKTLVSVLEQLKGQLGTSAMEAPMDAYGDKQGREEVIIRYTVGKGEFAMWNGKLVSALHCAMFKMNGERDGTFEGVWFPQIDPVKMAEKPAQPQDPLNEPEGPFPPTYIGAFTKAIWTFGDESAIIGIGPASLQLANFTDDSALFLVSVAGIIANGKGKYKNARGVKTALGATFIPKGSTFPDPSPGNQFGAVTIETFRVVRAKDIK
jgi:quinol monooxygenase YgiN